jgi:hypothetical protein
VNRLQSPGRGRQPDTSPLSEVLREYGDPPYGGPPDRPAKLDRSSEYRETVVPDSRGTPMTAPRNWSMLSRGARRRWIGAFGGPRSLPPEQRERRARSAYEAGEQLPHEHTGHESASEVTWSGVATTTGVRELTTRTYAEGRRVGEHSRDVLSLQDALADEEDWRERSSSFSRRWNRRNRSAGGFELEGDPERILVMTAAAGPPPQPFYVRSGRPR